MHAAVSWTDCSTARAVALEKVSIAVPLYMQGRGPKTNAFTHSLETNHHMFMKLDNGKVRLNQICWFHLALCMTLVIWS